MIFMMSTKEHESSLRIIIYHFAVLKMFLKFNHDLNDRVSLCINIFCEVVKCALYS